MQYTSTSPDVHFKECEASHCKASAAVPLPWVLGAQWLLPTEDRAHTCTAR